MLKITGCDSYTDCACLQIQPMISPWNLNLYKLGFLKSDIPTAWQCSTSKQDQPFPGGMHWSVRQLCHPLMHFPKPPFIMLPTVKTAADLSSLSWRGLALPSTHPMHFCFIHLFCYLQTDPHCWAWTRAQLPSSLPFHPMTRPLCCNLRFGRFLLQFIKLTVLRWGNLKGFPPCNSTPLQQRPTSYPQFCCRLFIDLHTLTEVLFFTPGLI